MHFRKAYLLFLSIAVFPASVLAQSNVKLDKAIAKFNAGQMEEAIADARKLLGRDDDTKVWNTIVEMYDYRLKDAVDPSARVAKEVMLGMGKGKQTNIYVRDAQACLNDLINACLEATYSVRSTYASQFLRNLLVDSKPDTAMSDDAKKAFEEAEDAFGRKDYQVAIKAYQRTIQYAPSHYQAVMYIGDCHFYLGQGDSAVANFRAAIAMQPGLLEPRKYIVDALGVMHRNDEAINEALPTFSIYPDESMFMKTSDLFERKGRTLERHWIRRGTAANQMGVEQKPGKGPWVRYRDAKKEIAPFCDDRGVVNVPGAPADAKYMEIYCWQRMLETPSLPRELEFAKRMADSGWLDCYVFVCLFHQDIYDQYRAFADSDQDRISRFITEVLVK